MSILLLGASCFLSRPAAARAANSRSGPTQNAAQAQASVQRQFAAALSRYKNRRYGEAEKILLPLAKSNNNSFEINELLGLVLVAQGQDEKANQFLEKAVRVKPDVAEARTTLATNLFRLHRTQEAELQFKKVVEIEPRSYDASHNLGEFYIQTGRLTEAIPSLKRAQEISPGAENNGYDFALVLEKTGKVDEARRELEALIRTNDSAELHSLLGEVEEKSRNYLASAKQYEQAVRMDPTEQNIFDWGTELLLHQAFEPAAEVFKAGLVRFPQSVRLHLGLGIALYGDSRYDDSAAAFLQSADMNPAAPLPLIFLGKAYENLSSAVAQQVLTRLKMFLEKNGNIPAVRYYYALALWKLNEKEPRTELPKEIEALLKEVVASDRGYTDAYLQLGILYANENRFQDAISNYEQALKLSPDLPNLHYRLGQALMRTGDAYRAREEFAIFERLRERQAQESDKQNSEIQQFVYTMRTSNGEKREESQNQAVPK